MNETPTGIHGARVATLADIDRALARYDARPVTDRASKDMFIQGVREILDSHKKLTVKERGGLRV